jgi:hypothetical protein
MSCHHSLQSNLRRFADRCYEVGLGALLFGLLVATVPAKPTKAPTVATVASSQPVRPRPQAPAPAAYCGKIQSSVTVITR